MSEPTTQAEQPEPPVTISAEHFAYLLDLARVGANNSYAPARPTRHRHLDAIEKEARESNDLAAQLKTLREAKRITPRESVSLTDTQLRLLTYFGAGIHDQERPAQAPTYKKLRDLGLLERTEVWPYHGVTASGVQTLAAYGVTAVPDPFAKTRQDVADRIRSETR
jgi:hypothetical protein